MANETGPAVIVALRNAIENKQWPVVKKQLSAVQTSLPPRATGTQIARALDAIREVADAFAEVCSFRTAFETAYHARRGLLKAGVCEWAVATLDGFKFFVPVIERVATVIGLLGTGVEERSHVGNTGAIDLLTTLWHKHPRCLELVSALSSLCSGHIDNVSRTMRQRGLVVAMNVLKDPESLDDHHLIERTLLYIGLCAICTPDNEHEGIAMVPTLIDILERVTEAGLPQVSEHAISAIGNISDCWLKEEHGYAIPDHTRLVKAIANSWSAFPRSRSTANCASHTLLSLSVTMPRAREAVLADSQTISNLIDGCRHSSTTLLSLQGIVNSASSDDASDSERRLLLSTPKSNRSRFDGSLDANSPEVTPVRRGRKRRRVTRGSNRSDVDVSKSVLLPNSPPKASEGDDGTVKRTSKRVRRRSFRSGDNPVFVGGGTTPSSSQLVEERSESLKTPQVQSRNCVANDPITPPEIIDLCSENEEQAPSPVGPRELALRGVVTSNTRRRATRK